MMFSRYVISLDKKSTLGELCELIFHQTVTENEVTMESTIWVFPKIMVPPNHPICS